MERNRWERAIRCLEIAVHPHTADEEVIAAINGFRRTAAGTPLHRLYREFGDPRTASDNAAIDRLNQENRDLQRRAETAETARNAALQRAVLAERNAEDIARELRAVEHRAEMAELRLAELQGAYGQISGGLHDENSDLRRALQEARRNLAQPLHEPVRPFQNLLDAALDRPTQAPPAPPPPAVGRPWWTA